jgi:hypothetical protein
VILEWCASDDIVLVVRVTAELSKLLSVRELDIHAILLHDTLDAATTHPNDPLVVRFGNMERYLRRQFFLQQRKAL